MEVNVSSLSKKYHVFFRNHISFFFYDFLRTKLNIFFFRLKCLDDNNLKTLNIVLVQRTVIFIILWHYFVLDVGWLSTLKDSILLLGITHSIKYGILSTITNTFLSKFHSFVIINKNAIFHSNQRFVWDHKCSSICYNWKKGTTAGVNE